MDIHLRAVSEDEFDSLFSVVKQSLYVYVDSVFGWDDDFQRHRLKTDYKPDWFYWIELASERVGLFCFKPYKCAYHIHLLIVLPEFQNQQIGTVIMHDLHHRAYRENRSRVTLSSFACNTNAIRFYQSLGYQVEARDEHFFSLALRLADFQV
ncbi:GNAT family N-acetyltransferase [Photobacterium sp. CCB-ST2H9]|uniref:GNAT family N-acetyltransferase n=1 Tax=Photobacterium sp. CCB-ST2H9 TaxID=2912855 RepID=UPI0020067310|nr:GNAT family N-acetyltransferase [Photobacterium sp. CCB-ST2H9]UTM59537.1 GNAT family N-acetyltransferase [Photobacterium sp. CCB-ST2H9]